MILPTIKSMLAHNRIMFRMVSYLRKSRLVALLHQLKNNKEKKENVVQRKEFAEFANAHKAEFARLSAMLEDDESRRVLKAVLEYRKTWDYGIISSINTKPQYFPKDIIKFEESEVLVDGGAYVGDSIYDFIKALKRSGGGYEHIYAWEPDAGNISAMKRNLSGYDNITVVPYAMYCRKAELSFDSRGDGDSRISDNMSGSMVKANTIDNIIKERVTFIKMDIEGAEIDALMGAEATIKKYKPKLAICIYHKPEHLYSVAFLIKSLVPEYRLYMRHHCDTYAETVLYAVI